MLHNNWKLWPFRKYDVDIDCFTLPSSRTSHFSGLKVICHLLVHVISLVRSFCNSNWFSLVSTSNRTQSSAKIATLEVRLSAMSSGEGTISVKRCKCYSKTIDCHQCPLFSTSTNMHEGASELFFPSPSLSNLAGMLSGPLNFDGLTKLNSFLHVEYWEPKWGGAGWTG